MLLPNTMFSVCSSKGLSGQSAILAFFGPDKKTEMGVVIYMFSKPSPDYIDSKYIYWLLCLTPEVLVLLFKYHFWHF